MRAPRPATLGTYANWVEFFPLGRIFRDVSDAVWLQNYPYVICYWFFARAPLVAVSESLFSLQQTSSSASEIACLCLLGIRERHIITDLLFWRSCLLFRSWNVESEIWHLSASACTQLLIENCRQFVFLPMTLAPWSSSCTPLHFVVYENNSGVGWGLGRRAGWWWGGGG